MTNEKVYDSIPGAKALAARFGFFPSFHDAEVVRVEMDRDGPDVLVVIHTFRMTDRLDDEGYYVLDTHTRVYLRFGRVVASRLEGFNHQNVLFGVSFEPGSDGTIIADLETSFGLDARIEAHSVEITHEPAEPAGLLASSVR